MSQKSNSSIISLFEHVNQRIVGQEHVTKAMVIALLTGGHILLEGLPGTAKTRAVKILSDALGLAFGRVQFTPDLLPSDVTGTQMYQQESASLVFQPGPIFNSIVLADEINRAPAKVQAALLEAMAENTVTAGGESLMLPVPFMVMATQNPIEQEGTYPLPEAQMDRFIMKIEVGYPKREAEMDIIHLMRKEELGEDSDLYKSAETCAFTREDLIQAKEEIKRIYCSPPIDQYFVDLVIATRQPEQYQHSKLSEWINVGVSPRASIALDKCSRAHAWIEGRDHVTPDDVRSVVTAVLGHRITPSFEALSDSVTTKQIIDELLLTVPLT